MPEGSLAPLPTRQTEKVKAVALEAKQLLYLNYLDHTTNNTLTGLQEREECREEQGRVLILLLCRQGGVAAGALFFLLLKSSIVTETKFYQSHGQIRIDLILKKSNLLQ